MRVIDPIGRVPSWQRMLDDARRNEREAVARFTDELHRARRRSVTMWTAIKTLFAMLVLTWIMITIAWWVG